MNTNRSPSAWRRQAFLDAWGAHGDKDDHPAPLPYNWAVRLNVLGTKGVSTAVIREAVEITMGKRLDPENPYAYFDYFTAVALRLAQNTVVVPATPPPQVRREGEPVNQVRRVSAAERRRLMRGHW